MLSYLRINIFSETLSGDSWNSCWSLRTLQPTESSWLRGSSRSPWHWLWGELCSCCSGLECWWGQCPQCLAWGRTPPWCGGRRPGPGCSPHCRRRADCSYSDLQYWLRTFVYCLCFLTTDYWTLTTDYLILTPAYWLLNTDYWLLPPDFWLLNTEHWLLTT